MDGYNLVINGVAAQDSVYHVRDFLEVGVFDNASDEHFLMLVNRYCQPQDMVEVKVKLNYTPTYRFESYFVIDALNNQAVTGLLPSTMDTSFTVSLLPGGGRLLKLVPITSIISINNDTRHTNYRFSHLYTSANTPYSEDSVRVVQSFFSSGKGNWDHTDTGWLPYTEESIQRLWPSDNNYPNVFEVYYKIDGGKIATPATHWQRNYNQQPPESGSLTLNGGAGYANSRNITVKVSGSDAVPGVEKKRYDESPFGLSSGYRNLIKNGVFNNDSSWTFFNATVQDGFVTLWGRDSLDTTQLSASIKQTVPESTVNACRGKLMRVTNYIYSQEVLKAQRYVDVFFQDTLTPSSIRYVFKNIASSAGGYWWNQTDTFSLDLGSRLVDRMEVWYRLYGGIEAKPGDPDSFRYTMDIDNVRLEPVYYDTVTQTVKDWWVNFGDSSAVYNYTVSAGDGSKRLYLQLEDSAENISPEPGWHSDIILDMTKPTADITSPLNNAYINGTVNIDGYAGDANFQGWTLEYKKYFLGTWTTLHNDTTQRVPPGSPMLLCQWNTTTVTDGKYYLRLTATDKATNAKADSHQVNVRNNGNPKGAIKPDFATFECLPVDAATDQLGNLYITDTQDNKVWKYSPDGDSLMCFGYRATGQDTTGFSQPVGIAVDDSCYIWVADCYNAKVKKFSQDGTMLLSFGEHGNGPGQFNQPTGLLVDSGVIYVTDKMNDRVQKFSSDGSFISQFGQDALWQPSGLAIKRESDDTVTNSYLYVSDTKHDRIVKFSLDGVLLDSLAYGIGLDQAWDISFDNFNNLFIADVQNNRIIELDPWDSPLWCFGGWGSDTGQFRLPQGLAVSPDGQYLYVVDTHNNRIQRVTVRSVDGGGGAQSVSRILMPSQIPNAFNLGQGYPNPSRQNASISFALPKAGDISLRIYNISGQLVKTLAQGNFNPGFYTVKWDGRDGKGIQAANGVYLYRLRAGGYERTIKAILLR